MNYKNNPFFKNYPSYSNADAQPMVDLGGSTDNDAQPMMDLGFDGYSNATAYPVYLVKTKYPATFVSTSNQTVNIPTGKTGTIQQLSTSLFEVNFGTKITCQFKTVPTANLYDVLKNDKIFEIVGMSNDKKNTKNTYSNFVAYPIIEVRAKKQVTITNGANQNLTIPSGRVGTFQQIENDAVSANSNDKLAEAIFDGNAIRFHYTALGNDPNALRALLLKNNEFDIISSKKRTTPNYSNLDAQPMIDLGGIDGSKIDLSDTGYSNAVGCGVAPVCSVTKIQTGTKRTCKTILGKEVCVNTPTVKTVPNQACINNKNKYNECAKNAKTLAEKLKADAKKLEDKAKEAIEKAKHATAVNKASLQKAADKAKADAQKATDKAKDAVKKAGVNAKKVIKSIKEKIGAVGKNFRNKLRQIIRKGVLFKIKNNAHGTATRMYPAIGNPANIKSRKYKNSFVSKSKSSYDKILKQWLSYGGTKSDLDAAIIAGSKKRFLKNPYKSISGNHSNSFYDAYIFNYYGADGSNLPEEYQDETVYPTEGITEEGVYNEETGEEEVPSEQETKNGLMGFIARIIAFFKGSGADENPYEEGSTEYTDYSTDSTEDAGNVPVDTNGDGVLSELDTNLGVDDTGGATDKTAGEDDLDTDEDTDTILGIPKTGFWIGVGVLTVIGGIIFYKKVIAKK